MNGMEIEEEIDNSGLKVKISKDNFIPLFLHGLRNSYDFTKKIGKGNFGKVFQVRNKKTDKLYACKKLSKLNINNLIKFKQEINILMKMDHPNIIKLYEVFESENSLYLIMEECFGGELFDKILIRIDKNEMYSEREACAIIKQIVGAIEYCHNKGIAHRDLKPENLLYLKEGDEEDNPLKIVDFGLSKKYDVQKHLTSKVGSVYYVAPEILDGNYNEKCDIWSTGVILFILLTGEPPFNGPENKVIFNKIKSYKYDFSNDKWKNISLEAKDLISKMLIPQEKRLSASQVLQHPWFALTKKESITFERLNFNKRNFFKEYKESNLLKKIVLYYIASKLEENEILELKKLFLAFDKDNNGQIDIKEFEKGVMELKFNGIKKEDIKNYFDEIDVDNRGKINYTEFIAATLEKKVYLKKEILFDAFSVLDYDKDGKITKEELMKVLKLQPKEDKFASQLIELADKNKDGFIDYKEFIEMMEYNN